MPDEDIKTEVDTIPTSEKTSKETQKTEKKTGDQNDSDFDYEKELESVEGAQKQPKVPAGSKYSPAEKATNAFRGTLKELKKHGINPKSLIGGTEEDGDDNDDTDPGKSGKTLTADDVEEIISRRTAEQRDELMEPIIDSKISPLTRSEGEAKLVKHYTKVLMQNGEPMDKAVEIGWFIANRHRFKETFAEMQRGKAAEKGKGDGSGSGQRKQTPRSEPTGKDAEFAKNRGLVWDPEANDGKGGHVSPARKTFMEKQRLAKKTQ